MFETLIPSGRAVLAMMRPDGGSQALRDARMRAMIQQLPLLFAILAVNTDLLAWSFVGHAPVLLSVVAPALLTACFVWRILVWLRLRGQTSFSPRMCARMLGGVIKISLFLGLGCSAWALSLCGYGDEAAEIHVAFYMSVTVIACIFCLTHVPAAALMLTASVLTPLLSGFFWMNGRHIPLVLSNAALVFAGLVYMLLNQSRTFAELIASRERILSAQTQAQALHAENLRLANLDQLTGLPNRRIFFESLGRRLAEGGSTAVAVVDLDGFKPVNDVFGHGVGDLVLEETARRLRGFARPGDIARLGGDEFAIIVTGCLTAEALRGWARGVRKALAEPYVFTEATVRLSASIGLSPFSQGGGDGESLMEMADYALYSAKAGRRGEAAVFTDAHGREIHRLSLVGQALRSETLADELSLMFQPIVDSHTGATLGFEALARWQSPTLGQVAPQEFIGVAERLGLVSRLTVILLEKALAEAAKWPAGVRLSFNLSANDLMSPEAMEDVRSLVRAGAFPAGRLDFEVTETSTMGHFDQAAAALQSLRDLGCCVSLDDFGTGSSSLSCVHRLPLDKIKIDRSFVLSLEQDESAVGVVGAIVSMCGALRLDCIVEGVETPAQLLRLRQLGCRMMQGYLFSRPIAASEVIPHLSGPTFGPPVRRKAVTAR